MVRNPGWYGNGTQKHRFYTPWTQYNNQTITSIHRNDCFILGCPTPRFWSETSDERIASERLSHTSLSSSSTRSYLSQRCGGVQASHGDAGHLAGSEAVYSSVQLLFISFSFFCLGCSSKRWDKYVNVSFQLYNEKAVLFPAQKKKRSYVSQQCRRLLRTPLL